MHSDDLDDILDGRRAELEARFRELEYEAEIERLRQQSPGTDTGAGDEPSAPAGDGEPDPLADLKAALEKEKDNPRYLLVLCPHCGAKNRMNLVQARAKNPICVPPKDEVPDTHRF